VLRAAQKASGGVRTQIGRQPRGAVNGRGRVAAKLLSQSGGPRDRRVVIKTRLVVLAEGAAGSTAAHLRYIQRDGVAADQDQGRAYGPMADAADTESFEARGREDRHQFRFIVSAEDAQEIGDLRRFTRELLGRMEADLGTRLDWVAVDHYDTDNPHSHVVLRGVDDQGRDLVIARDYIAHGMRARAAVIATNWLGPQTEQELRERLAHETAAERWTGLDRRLVARSHGGLVALPTAEALLRARIATLERLGLAQAEGSERWRLRSDLESTLRAMGERGDILRTMQRAFGGAPRELEIVHERAGPDRVIGRVIAKGLADEMSDRGCLVLDGLDGKGCYVALPPGQDLGAVPLNAVVAVSHRSPGPRPADRTIADLAEAGVYRPSRHLARPEAEARSAQGAEDLVRAHVRRLEALRRAGVVERVGADAWRLPPDFLARVAAYENGRFGAVRVEVLAHEPPARTARLLGATWLDRALIDGVHPAPVGFGATTAQALEARRLFLFEQGLAEPRGREWHLAPSLLATLRDRELAQAAARIAGETGLEHRRVNDGETVRGTYRRRLDLVSGRFAMVDDGMGFSLVPWRPVIDPRLGREVEGLVRAHNVQWSFGRQRGV
jgi:type IV secretory pathway VirD2 relaxase